MRDAVRRAFYDFNVPMEGAIDHLYQDTLGLVSIGVGLLCDPIQLALGLPLVHPDGTPATRSDIAAEWAKVKSLGSGTHEQGNEAARRGHLYAKPHTRLRLTEEGLRATMMGKMDLHDATLKKLFPDFEEWPADAQLALHSWAWGVGPAAPYPKMIAALRARDFAAAANEIRMVANGVELHGLKPRNKANALLLRNAAVVAARGNPEELYWPLDIGHLSAVPTAPDPPVDRDADTVPELVPSVPPRDGARTVTPWDIARGLVPLGRVALDGDLPDSDPEEPPSAA